MKSIFSIVFALLLSTAFISCDKDKDSPDLTEAKLTITSPSSSQKVKSGELITVKAEATSPTTLHGYKVEAKNENNGNEIFKNEVHTHGNTLTFTESFPNTALPGEKVKITVSVAIDHDQNSIEKSVTITTE